MTEPTAPESIRVSSEEATREDAAPSDRLRHAALPFAVLAACAFALLWLGAEVTIARLQQENARLAGTDALTHAPAASRSAPTSATVASGASGPRVLTAEQRAAMVQALSSAPDRRAWLVRPSGDAEIAAYADQLVEAFSAAGFTVQVSAWNGGPLKPGVRLFVGPDQVPPSVEPIGRALAAGGVAFQQFLGYRAYRVERARTEPAGSGIDLADDQDFVIVVGRRE